MDNSITRKSLDADIDQISEALTRIRGKGTLAELLECLPALEQQYETRTAQFSWRATEDVHDIVRELHKLRTAVQEETLNPNAHMMDVVRLGIFTTFYARREEALAIVKDYLINH